jgi:2-phospho-L-lactate/phosphoenolpyruvate guanylyltransferase
MNIWAVIPAKPANEGKSRLAGVLSVEQRIRLNEHLFRRTLAIVCAAFPPSHVMVVSRDSTLLGIAAAAGAHALTEHGHELNQALDQAADFPRLTGGLLAISADLPTLALDDLHAILATPHEVTIAPDRRGTGTNALLTNPAGGIPFRFGEDSFALHSAEAARRGIVPLVISRPGLAFDLDTPEDLRACPGLIAG